MMKLILGALLILLAHLPASAQLKMHHFNEVDSLLLKEKRPLFIFIHTSWCKYCLKMEAKTFQHDSIITLLNKSFYAIELNAEDTSVIHYGGQTFPFVPNGINSGTHSLAKELGTNNGGLNFPTICIVQNGNEVAFLNSGYVSHKNLKTILNVYLKSQDKKD